MSFLSVFLSTRLDHQLLSVQYSDDVLCVKESSWCDVVVCDVHFLIEKLPNVKYKSGSKTLSPSPSHDHLEHDNLILHDH